MKGFCEICSAEIEIIICCNAFDCACGGRPIEPPVCSESCHDKFMNTPKDESLTQIDIDHSMPF